MGRYTLLQCWQCLNYLNHISVTKLPVLLSRGCHLVLNTGIYTETE